MEHRALALFPYGVAHKRGVTHLGDSPTDVNRSGPGGTTTHRTNASSAAEPTGTTNLETTKVTGTIHRSATPLNHVVHDELTGCNQNPDRAPKLPPKFNREATWNYDAGSKIPP